MMHIPALYDHLNPFSEADDDGDDDRNWIVLYPEDYDNVMLDGAGNLFVLVDDEQAAEVERLAAEAQASMGDADD